MMRLHLHLSIAEVSLISTAKSTGMTSFVEVQHEHFAAWQRLGDIPRFLTSPYLPCLYSTTVCT